MTCPPRFIPVIPTTTCAQSILYSCSVRPSPGVYTISLYSLHPPCQTVDVRIFFFFHPIAFHSVFLSFSHFTFSYFVSNRSSSPFFIFRRDLFLLHDWVNRSPPCLIIPRPSYTYSLPSATTQPPTTSHNLPVSPSKGDVRPVF